MDIKRNRQIDRAYAEQLLAGDTTVDGALADVLAAASAPPDTQDLLGEETAVAMFNTARAAPAPQAHHRRTRSLTRLLTAKVAAVLVVITLSVGGVAVAASTGVLPALPHHDGTPAASASPRPAQASTSARALGAGPGASSAAASGSSPASLRGRCHAYAAAVAAGRTNALSDPRFAGLIAAAGGASQVAAYCQTLLAGLPGGGDATPVPHPTGKPTAHPGGKPTTHPSGRVHG